MRRVQIYVLVILMVEGRQFDAPVCVEARAAAGANPPSVMLYAPRGQHIAWVDLSSLAFVKIFKPVRCASITFFLPPSCLPFNSGPLFIRNRYLPLIVLFISHE